MPWTQYTDPESRTTYEKKWKNHHAWKALVNKHPHRWHANQDLGSQGAVVPVDGPKKAATISDAIAEDHLSACSTAGTCATGFFLGVTLSAHVCGLPGLKQIKCTCSCARPIINRKKDYCKDLDRDYYRVSNASFAASAGMTTQQFRLPC